MKNLTFKKLLAAAVFCFCVFATGELLLTGPVSAKVETGEALKSTGAELFAQNCARCHGEDAHGGRGPNLTSPKRQAKWKSSDEKIVKQITNGGIFMPAFKKKLVPDQIKSTAEYVPSLKP